LRRAKDDPRDADLLLQHRDKLRRLTLVNEATRQIRNLVEERRKLVEDKDGAAESPDRIPDKSFYRSGDFTF
jgi:hypothetical protein